MRSWIFFGVLLVFCVAFMGSFGDSSAGRYIRARDVSYAFDAGGHAGAEEMSRAEFFPSRNKIVDPGSRVIWLKIAVPRDVASLDPDRVVLFTGSNEAAYSFHAYIPTKSGIRDLGECDAHFQSNECTNPSLQYAYTVDLKSGLPQEILLKVESAGSGIWPQFYFMPQAYYRISNLELQTSLGLACGIFIIVAMMNLVFFFSLRETGFLVYGGFYLVMFASLLVSRGFWDGFVPGSRWLEASFITLALTYALAVLDLAFLTAFFGLRRTNPRIFGAIVFFWGSAGLLSVLSFIPSFRAFAWKMLGPMVCIWLGLGIATLCVLMKERRKWASAVASAWSISILGNLIWIAFGMGLLSGHWLLGYFSILGRVCECLILMNVVFMKLRFFVEESAIAKAKAQEGRVLRALYRTLYHDISNTTQAIAGSSAAFGTAEDPGERAKAVSRLNLAVASQVSIVREARKSCAPGIDGQVLQLQGVNLRESLEKVKALYRELTERYGIKVDLELPPETVFVRAEPLCLVHHVLSVLLNSRTRMVGHGGRVELKVRQGEAQVEILISDSTGDTSFGRESEFSLGNARDFVEMFGGTLDFHRATVSSKGFVSLRLQLEPPGGHAAHSDSQTARSSDASTVK